MQIRNDANGVPLITLDPGELVTPSVTCSRVGPDVFSLSVTYTQELPDGSKRLLYAWSGEKYMPWYEPRACSPRTIARKPARKRATATHTEGTHHE